MRKSKREIERKVKSAESESGEDEPHPSELRIVRRRVDKQGNVVETVKDETVNYDPEK